MWKYTLSVYACICIQVYANRGLLEIYAWLVPLHSYLLALFFTESGQAQKSGVMVEMEDLSFHFRSPGDLSDDELEEITNFLSERMNTQEVSELNQLHHFYNTLAW